MKLAERLPGPPTEEDFDSPLRDERLTARIGVLLGICFGLAFVTGLISHLHYSPEPWLPLPSRPVWGYRVTQGLHVLSGTAAIPLLLVKLWSVYPKLFAEIPKGRIGTLVLNLVERASIGVLVAAAIFELASGLANSSQWYPWGFHFRATHYAIAWLAIGSLILHIAVKLPVIRRALGEPLTGPEPGPSYAGPSRRALLRTTWIASGVAVAAAAGNTVPFLRKVSVFAVRNGRGPEGIPINKSAKAADVVATALDSSFTLTLRRGAREVSLTRADLKAMTQRGHTLPIACVEGWSASGTWTGVRLRELLDLVDGPAGSDVEFRSLQQHGAFGHSLLPGNFADDPLTLLALRLNGEELSIDHGYPCRLIAPDRPGVFQTKWVHEIEVQA
ncbi:MAG: molybdopterin-binding protein [Marmoricola sp.]|nr:molybdopterin-binding protein [Marmoricola sp.]